ncbi:MAG: flavodoxin, partial [Agathobacter sp.]
DMKKVISFMLSLTLVFVLVVCVNVMADSESGDMSDKDISQVKNNNNGLNEESTSSKIDEVDSSSILIAYFTYGENADLSDDVDASSTASIQVFNGEITGNTGVMADMIAMASGGELFSIRTAEPYPDNYDDTIDVGEAEKNNDARPEISTHIENLEQYDTVFIGFPNWWYGMPMVMYSFFDEYDFSGKTIIPFCTSGGSGFSDAIEEIRNLEPGATVLEGLHIGGSSVSDAENRVSEWVEELGLSK